MREGNSVIWLEKSLHESRLNSNQSTASLHLAKTFCVKNVIKQNPFNTNHSTCLREGQEQEMKKFISNLQKNGI